MRQFLIAFICFLVILLFFNVSFSQNTNSIYFRNLVRHFSGEICNHTSPTATFTAYINQDQSRVLIENAPRWTLGTDPNIDGKGTFGVELGNFTNPAVVVGDTVSIRFTCNVTKQQGVLTDIVTAIPWITFPQTLYLSTVKLPDSPQNVTLTIDENYNRIIYWTQEQGMTYSIYRRTVQDTIHTGQSRMLYNRIAENLSSGTYVDTMAIAGERYGYILYAISEQGEISSHSEEINEEAKIGDDLTIGWIARLPRIDYVWSSAHPDLEGWPEPEQQVIWQANVKNWFSTDVHNVTYKWYMDGIEVSSDEISIPTGEIVTVDYPWFWEFRRYELKFVIDTENIITEEEEKNNELTIYTNAISVGFYVEQSVYDYFRQYQRELGVHAMCWEDWAQRHVQRWNQMFANAIYSDTPLGVRDRIRIDKITVVPDRALPLAGGNYPTNMPNLNDRTVDLQWGFPATLLDGTFYANHTRISDDNPFYFEGSLLHELGHARYLIDLYGFNVHDNGNGNTVAIKENDRLIVGTEYMPLVAGAVHWTPIKGLMNGQYAYIDSYSAVALNLIAGNRAIKGNYNAPGNIGVFINDLPQENRLTIMDILGNILAGADIMIYRATGQSGVWYGKYYDNVPDIHLTADANGQVLLGRCPFDRNGTIEHDYGKANGVIILRVEHENKVGYTFLESTLFNMEYWRGNTSLGNYEVQVNLINPAMITESISNQLPKTVNLYQNYPNPFNTTTTIHYQIPIISHSRLVIFNVLGEKVRILFDDELNPGYYSITWDGMNDEGSNVNSGIYFYQLEADNISITNKMILLE